MRVSNRHIVLLMLAIVLTMGRLLCAREEVDPLGFYGTGTGYFGPDDGECHLRGSACSCDGLPPVPDAAFLDHHRLIDDVRAREGANLSVVLGESEEAIAYATRHGLLMLPRDADRLAVKCHRVAGFDLPIFEVTVEGNEKRIIVECCDKNWSVSCVNNGQLVYNCCEEHGFSFLVRSPVEGS